METTAEVSNAEGRVLIRMLPRLAGLFMATRGLAGRMLLMREDEERMDLCLEWASYTLNIRGS